MKILILTWHFPPNNAIAAIRIGKLARYLHRQGHDIRVLTGLQQSKDASLPVEIPSSLIIRTEWLDIDRLAHPFARRRARPDSGGAEVRRDERVRSSSFAKFKAQVSLHYNEMFFFPDRQVGWVPYGVASARRLFREWSPDLIFASGPPFSLHVAASLIHKSLGVPWIAEYRDRWSDDPYSGGRYRGRFSRFLASNLERRCVRGASGIVTVSEPWAEMYRRTFSLPTAVVYNGFDPADFPLALSPPPAKHGPLTISHMGTVYAGRDPTPLFAAIAQSGLSPSDVKVQFYGAEAERITPLAERLGVASHVEALNSVPYAESLRIQRESDVLLLLQWNNPEEFGNVPAKIFEYFATQRPILGIGLESGVPAALIRSNDAGLFSNDPAAICEAIQGWVRQKRELGAVPSLPQSVRDGFSRDEQYAKLESFAQALVASHGSARARVAPAPEPEPCIPADLSAFDKPVLTVIVDTEEEFDWGAPFSREAFSIAAIQQQPLLQAVLDRAGAIPTYLVDYPVAADREAVHLLRDLMERGKCVIGAQLHPWVNPPDVENLSQRNSFLNNLDPAVQERKLDVLTQLIRRQFAIEPTIFKAGRFGFDRTTVPLLRKFGYQVDTSVVPHTSFAEWQGPSFIDFPDQPFWFDSSRDLLELPLSCGFTGALADGGDELFHKLDRKRFRRLHVGGVLARAGVLERIKLSPEGIDLAAQKRLTRALVKRGHKVFVLSFHSSSLAPGGTPYVRNQKDLAVLLQRIDGFLSFFREDIGGAVVSVPAIVDRIAKSELPRKERSERQLAS